MPSTASSETFPNPRSNQFLADLFDIMVAMWGTGHEARGVMREQCCQRFRYDIGKLVFRNSVPDVEKEMTARLENPARLLVTLNFIRKEHHAELAGHDIKALIRKRQSQCIGLSPLDPAIMRQSSPCMIKHRLVEIGRYDARVYRNPRSHRSRQNSSTRGRFQHILRLGFGYPLGQIERIGFEDEGHQNRS